MTDDEIRQIVEDLYVGIFGRTPDAGGAEHMGGVLRKGGVPALIKMLNDFTHGDEATRRRLREQERQLPVQGEKSVAIDDYRYRIPDQLRREPSKPTKLLLIGSCLLDSWPDTLRAHEPDVSIERITFNNASALPEMTKDEIRAFDFQIIQIPLRSLLMEAMYFGVKNEDEAGWRAVFDRSCEMMQRNVEAALTYNRQAGIRSFVLNLPMPQQNPVGRLQPRYTYSNLIFFTEQLNIRLYEMIAGYADCHMIDFDQIIATYGRKYFQDDIVTSTAHGSALRVGVSPLDLARIEPFGDFRALYTPRVADVLVAVYEEVKAADRTIRQQDSVKIAIFDLDDTLWRGILAEADEIGFDNTEGWPIGVIEAISALWKRGVLIAIVSKNDEERTRANWEKLYRRDFPIDRFVSVKIGWGPKPLAIQEILDEVNLLPSNAIFVDDNPVERAAVQEAFPDIRVVGGSPLEWRRILLWSAETQTAKITNEAGARTEMIQAQIRRTTEEAGMDRASFLASLDLQIAMRKITGDADPQFARALELLNKTNQFNTTGRRWAHAELSDLFANGGYLLAGTVSDRFSDYGLVALAVVRGDVIEQYVMSCRVFGMEVEHSMLASAVKEIAQAGHAAIRGRIAATEKNKLSMPLYSANGFTAAGDGLWSRPASDAVPHPAHVKIAA